MLGANWRTSLFGIIVIVLGVLGPVLNHYAPVVGLDWIMLCTSLATLAGGAGLVIAKDKDVTGGTKDAGVRPTPEATAEAKAKVAEGKTP